MINVKSNRNWHHRILKINQVTKNIQSQLYKERSYDEGSSAGIQESCPQKWIFQEKHKGKEALFLSASQISMHHLKKYPIPLKEAGALISYYARLRIHNQHAKFSLLSLYWFITPF